MHQHVKALFIIKSQEEICFEPRILRRSREALQCLQDKHEGKYADQQQQQQHNKNNVQSVQVCRTSVYWWLRHWLTLQPGLPQLCWLELASAMLAWACLSCASLGLPQLCYFGLASAVLAQACFSCAGFGLPQL